MQSRAQVVPMVKQQRRTGLSLSLTVFPLNAGLGFTSTARPHAETATKTHTRLGQTMQRRAQGTCPSVPIANGGALWEPFFRAPPTLRRPFLRVDPS